MMKHYSVYYNNIIYTVKKFEFLFTWVYMYLSASEKKGRPAVNYHAHAKRAWHPECHILLQICNEHMNKLHSNIKDDLMS